MGIKTKVVARGPAEIRRLYFKLKNGKIGYEFGFPHVPRILGPRETLGVLLEPTSNVEYDAWRSYFFSSKKGRWVVEKSPTLSHRSPAGKSKKANRPRKGVKTNEMAR